MSQKPDFRRSLNELFEAHPELRDEEAAARAEDGLLEEWRSSVPARDEAALDAAWESFSRRLRREAPVRRSWPWAAALAAACLALAVGSITLWQASRELRRAQAPVAAVAVLDLVAPLHRGAGGLTEVPDAVPVPAGAELVVLLIEPQVKGSFARYGLRATTPQGAPVFDLAGLEKNEFGSLPVALRRSSLPDGALSLELWAERDGQRQVVGRYELQVAVPVQGG